MVFQHFRFLDPPSPNVYASCLIEASFFSFLRVFLSIFQQDNPAQMLLRSLGMPFAPLPLQKSISKTDGFSTFSLFGPTKPPHICIILAISCLEAHLFSVLLICWSLFQPKTIFSSTLFYSWNVLAPLPPSKNL